MRMRLLGLISATALTACGGGSDAPPAPAASIPVAPALPVAPPVVPVVPPAPTEPTPAVPVTPPPLPPDPTPGTPVPPPVLETPTVPVTPPGQATPPPVTATTPATGPAVPPTPTASGPYTLPAHTVGDFATYTDVTLGWKVSITQRITKVNADGGWENADSVSQEKGPQTIEVFDKHGGMLSTNSSGYACVVTYAPAALQAPPSAAVGDSFDYASTMSIPCSTEEISRALTSKGKVVAIESKTVAAGTFTALKIVSSETNFDLRTSGASANYWVDKTCWRDTVTGLIIACNTSTTSKGTGGMSYTSASELASFSQAATKREYLDPIRFAGPWTGSFGAYYGTCDVNITFTGVITGACKATARATSVTGSVDKAGVVKLNMSVTGGATDTNVGQAALFDMSGTLAGAAAPGSWTLKHK
ncbi:hypothetical protein IV454_27130 [Massilia antarctica]|uniref:Uncharacterized protein n=1 Tax=Massilia antarctica TaxID=2765360 RepID=A0AA48WAR4_9BURK|nr:hypothetical protein [Massilia antarctica]QPI49106.1 hypothetical protein IV454_27130 [Massilia antarctica]